MRAVAGPLLLACALAGSSGAGLAALVAVAFVTDVFDGIVARRLGVATEALRRADTVADAAFYLCATATLLLRFPEAVRDHPVGIGALVVLELARWALERGKYGRIAAYHMWSAKAWGITLWLGFSEVFLTGHAGLLFEAAIVVGILADLEGLAASVLLSTWRHDVPTLWHALQIERARRNPTYPLVILCGAALLLGANALRAAPAPLPGRCAGRSSGPSRRHRDRRGRQPAFVMLLRLEPDGAWRISHLIWHRQSPPSAAPVGR